MSDHKAWVLMEFLSEDTWCPVAVFTDRDEANRVQREMHNRLYGPISRDMDSAVPGFRVESTLLNPEVSYTMDCIVEKRDDDDEWYPLHAYVENELAGFDAPGDVMGFVYALECGDEDYRLSRKGS